MNPVELVTAGVVVLGTVVIGTIVHETAHAVALETFGIPYEIAWLPANAGESHLLTTTALASVTPRLPSGTRSPWKLRIAAMMPLCMTIPVILALLGLLPDPVSNGNSIGTAVVIGWLACALPSPQDFSLFWYTEEAIREQPTQHGETAMAEKR